MAERDAHLIQLRRHHLHQILRIRPMLHLKIKEINKVGKELQFTFRWFNYGKFCFAMRCVTCAVEVIERRWKCF